MNGKDQASYDYESDPIIVCLSIFHHFADTYKHALKNVLHRFQPDRISKLNDTGCIPLHIACLNIERVSSDIFLKLLEEYPEGNMYPFT